MRHHRMKTNSHFDFLVAGGGAAGFFAAIRFAAEHPGSRVAILEKSREVLQKVKISGGGRCNLTHACFDPKELVKNYPRGAKALIGAFSRFGPADTLRWFQRRGVRLKTEADGRMFPASNDSQTIVDCLLGEARKAGVLVLKGQNVTNILPPGEGKNDSWMLQTQGGDVFSAKRLMVATGSNPRLWQLLEKLGHRIVPPVPSLFTFNVKDSRLAGMAGVSVADALVRIPQEQLHASGPLLITHWGMSGPAILRLSAWGARELHRRDYRFAIEVNWLASTPQAQVVEILNKTKIEWAKRTILGSCPFPTLPKRLWEKLATAAGVTGGLRWADLNKTNLGNLRLQLTAAPFSVSGKSTFKEEFVTAGGVHLDEVDFKRFESKICSGLFLAGEVLDIDAITGGFNFQAAWTGGWLAGGSV